LKNVAVDYYNLGSDIENEMAAMQSMLSQIGASIKPTGITENQYFQYANEPLSKAHVPMLFTSWGASPADPAQFFDFLLLPNLPNNIGDYKNSKVTKLAQQADVAADPQRRAALYIRASHIVQSQAGIIVTGQGICFGMYKPYVHGLVRTAVTGTDCLVPRHADWSQVTVSGH
jgi:ABC-type transport system substrate-binding protein